MGYHGLPSEYLCLNGCISHAQNDSNTLLDQDEKINLYRERLKIVCANTNIDLIKCAQYVFGITGLSSDMLNAKKKCIRKPNNLSLWEHEEHFWLNRRANIGYGHFWLNRRANIGQGHFWLNRRANIG